MRAAAQAERVAREIDDLERRVAGKSRSLAHDFDRVLDLLSNLGYVDLERFEVTESGLAALRVSRDAFSSLSAGLEDLLGGASG